jgi:hypothetical protein
MEGMHDYLKCHRRLCESVRWALVLLIALEALAFIAIGGPRVPLLLWGALIAMQVAIVLFAGFVLPARESQVFLTSLILISHVGFMMLYLERFANGLRF